MLMKYAWSYKYFKCASAQAYKQRNRKFISDSSMPIGIVVVVQQVTNRNIDDLVAYRTNILHCTIERSATGKNSLLFCLQLMGQNNYRFLYLLATFCMAHILITHFGRCRNPMIQKSFFTRTWINFMYDNILI